MMKVRDDDETSITFMVNTSENVISNNNNCKDDASTLNIKVK